MGYHVLVCFLSTRFRVSENLQLDSIDIFWMKLDISDMTSVVDDNINCDNVVNKFKENFNKKLKAGKMFYRRKLEEIYDPHKCNNPKYDPIFFCFNITKNHIIKCHM
uniref:Uncharacterized protein n=1 Tax=Lactuca sativa TaxID=4236 RepID=A0A9R1VPK3_LACSA|nr:hypothetical protein LSAT_V11C400210870 [Lactuca sativa]